MCKEILSDRLVKPTIDHTTSTVVGCVDTNNPDKGLLVPVRKNDLREDQQNAIPYVWGGK